MRNISFALTTEQMRARTKTVTRRLGWVGLAVGELLCAIVKGQGLKKGEKVERLGVIRVTKVGFEQLGMMRGVPDECVREGFPEMSPWQFIEMFCQSHRGCTPSTVVTRIEFEHVVEHP